MRIVERGKERPVLEGSWIYSWFRGSWQETPRSGLDSVACSGDGSIFQVGMDGRSEWRVNGSEQSEGIDWKSGRCGASREVGSSPQRLSGDKIIRPTRVIHLMSTVKQSIMCTDT